MTVIKISNKYFIIKRRKSTQKVKTIYIHVTFFSDSVSSPDAVKQFMTNNMKSTTKKADENYSEIYMSLAS